MSAERPTRADLDRQVSAIAAYSADLGIIAPTDRLVFETGSKVNGISFKLAVVHEGETGHATFDPAGSFGFVGWTAREAFQTLTTMRAALGAACNPRHPSRL